MEPEKFYYDPIIDRNICIKYQTTGYCSDLMTCSYLHRNKQHQGPFLAPMLVVPLPQAEKKPEKKFIISQLDSPNSVKCKLASYKLDEAEQYKPKNPKIDLMPSLRKKGPSKPQAKLSNCNHCRRLQPEDNLFCNSFCGHLLCFECCHRDKTCSACGADVDIATAEEFFKWYCKRCETQNTAKSTDHLCKDCKLEEQLHQVKLKKQSEQIESSKDSTLICIICMHRKKEYAVFPCAHMLYCEICVGHVNTSKLCFFCNRAVTGSCRIYY